MTTSNRHKNNELLFHQKIQSQLFQVRALLKVPCSGYSHPNHQRSPVYFADYPKHTYQDKFGLAEFLTNVAIASQMNILDVLGVDEEKFRLMHGIVNGISSENREHSKDAYANCNRLVLRFAAEENCVKIEQDDPPVLDEVEASTPGKMSRKSTDGLREGPFFGKKKSVKEIKEASNWKVTVEYSIKVIATSSRSLDGGNTVQKDPMPILLKSRTAEAILHTLVNAPPPLQARAVRDPIDFDLTWFFKNISSDDFSCNFAIDQSHKSCHTPRRNRDIDAAVKYFSELEGWCHDICTYFLKGTCWNVEAGEKRPNLNSIDADVVFVPVLPIFEPPSSAILRKNDKGHGEIKSLSPLLPIDDIRLFLSEQCRTLDEKIQDLVANYPPADPVSIPNTNTPSAEAALQSFFSGAPPSLITSAEATLFLLFTHSASITEYYIDSLQAIEQSTVEALNRACGREVSQRDFDNFVRYSNSTLFANEVHSPKPFKVDIRRPNRVPEGIVRIEMCKNIGTLTFDSEETWPIPTISKEVTPSESAEGEETYIQINIPSVASMTKILGVTFVHGWLTHQFAGHRDFQYQLRTVSRQFSNFVVLTGTISHHRRMDVKNAMIIQNKDEVVIPLNLCRARAVGDFPGLVSSLSPQQQSFAQSAREMQLESSVFAVCVVEIKPQLEILLGLPSNSLTKEIKLVSTLLNLFVDHQISSDLLSYEGPATASVKEMIDEVKSHVGVAVEMINNIPVEDTDEVLSAEVSTEDMVEEPRFQRATIMKEASVRGDRDKISASASDDNTSIADLFRKKRSNDTTDPTLLMDELGMGLAKDQFIIDPFLKSMRRIPSVDMESMGGDNREDTCKMVDIPRKLNEKLKSLQNNTPLQPTAVKTGDVWMQKNSLNARAAAAGGPAKDIGSTDQEVNTKKAMNLLDALSRSGSLPIQFAQVHAIVGVTHCFQNTLMDTLVLDNVDPIKKLTESTLLLASVIHDTSVDSLKKTC